MASSQSRTGLAPGVVAEGGSGNAKDCTLAFDGVRVDLVISPASEIASVVAELAMSHFVFAHRDGVVGRVRST